MTFLEILGQTIPVFIVIAIGCLCRATKMFTESSERATLSLVLNVLYPCFILTKVCGNEALKQTSTVTSALSVGLGLTLLSFVVANLVGHLLKLKAGKAQNTFNLAAAIQNYGFIPIPLIAGIFPADIANETLGVLFVFNLGLELAFWTVGVVIVSGSRNGMWWRLVNGPTIAIVLGLTLNFTGGYLWIPGVVNSAMGQLGNCSVPVSLILVGVSFAGVVAHEKLFSGWRIPTGAFAVRFVIMPIVYFTAAYLLSFSRPLMLILIVQAAMPAAVFPIVIAKHFGGKPSVAAEISVFTSLASLALTPAIICLGTLLFDLNFE
jgi:predicted permease